MRSLLVALLCPILAHADGKVFTVEYPPSEKEGGLIYGVTYRLWVPENVKNLRAVIVHQHGCGAGACKGGLTAADDLHWQALARKWDAALLGPSFHQPDGADCRQWCDPRHGSEKAFLDCLADFARQTGHPELVHAPWVLWGHSGGGFWSSLMLTLHPDRIAAIWFRSGSAFATWEKGDIPKPALSDAVYQVPLMFNGGVKEANDPRHGPARVGDRAMFESWRQHGAFAGLAPDPRTGHECGDSRYLAIPWIDACLAMRLPAPGDDIARLRPVDPATAWFAESDSQIAAPAGQARPGQAPKAESWLPNEAVAKAWMEYVKTGAVGDTTPPPAPTHVQARPIDGTPDIEITWRAQADLESGIRQFVIERDGAEIGRVPEKPAGKFGRPLFQGMSYGDTPESPVAAMRFVIKDAPVNIRAPSYRVRSINGVGLQSE